MSIFACSEKKIDRSAETVRTPRAQELAADLVQINQDDYIIVNGLRYVVPYKFEFRVSFKERWRGRTLLEVFTDEFPHASAAYWTQEIRRGRVLCNGTASGVHQRWGEGDEVIHVVHRHESPVIDRAITVVHEDKDILVVNKPPSWPCHPCGTYRKNSLLYILAAKGWRNLRIVHRLDKQTSGVVLFGKSRESARDLTRQMVERKFRKRYLARVRGQFPNATLICNEPLSFNEKTMKASVDVVNGKSAETEFEFLNHDEVRDTSIVLCVPRTGRTHQIRVHLQFIGHPIVNDLYYAKRVKDGDECISLARSNKETCCLDMRNSFDEDGRIRADGGALECINCPYLDNLKNHGQDDMIIDLHAYEYEIEGRRFTTSLPNWAADVGDFLDTTHKASTAANSTSPEGACSDTVVSSR